MVETDFFVSVCSLGLMLCMWSGWSGAVSSDGGEQQGKPRAGSTPVSILALETFKNFEVRELVVYVLERSSH